LHPGIASYNSTALTSGAAHGGIHGMVSSHGGLHPDAATLSSYSSTFGAQQCDIHGLVSSQGGLRPDAATLSSYTPTSGAAQGGINGMRFSQGGFHPTDTFGATQGGRQLNFQNDAIKGESVFGYTGSRGCGTFEMGDSQNFSKRRIIDLPNFHGLPKDWPILRSIFVEITLAYNFSDLENLL